MSVYFTTPITYSKNSFFNKFEEFFNFRGNKVVEFDAKKHIGVNSHSSIPVWKNVLKVAACFTLVVPLFALIGKSIGRIVKAPIKVDQEQGLAWAMKNDKIEIFNKILKATPLWMISMNIKNYGWEKDNAESIKIILDKDSKEIFYNPVQFFRNAIIDNKQKILKYLTSDHQDLLAPETEGFKECMKSIVKSQNTEAIDRILAYQVRGGLQNALKIALKENSLKAIKHIVDQDFGGMIWPEHIKEAHSVDAMDMLLSDKYFIYFKSKYELERAHTPSFHFLKAHGKKEVFQLFEERFSKAFQKLEKVAT